MRLATVTLALVLLVTGCGGNKKSAHAKYVERADATCTSYGQALHQIPQPPDPTSAVQVAPYLQRFVPLLARENAALRAIAPPSEDAAKVQRFLQAQDAQAFWAERARVAAARENQARMQASLSQWQLAVTAAAQVGNELGFKACTGTSSATR